MNVPVVGMLDPHQSGIKLKSLLLLSSWQYSCFSISVVLFPSVLSPASVVLYLSDNCAKRIVLLLRAFYLPDDRTLVVYFYYLRAPYHLTQDC